MTNINRRTFLSGLLSFGFIKFNVLKANQKQLIDPNLQNLLNQQFNLNFPLENAKNIRFALPTTTYNNKLVPIKIDASFYKDVEQIIILADKNTNPVIYSIDFHDKNALAYLTTRVTIEQSSTVRVIIKRGKTSHQIVSYITVFNEGC